MSVVIDASVALKWVLDEPGGDAADILREQDLIAPDLWLLEAANVLWRLARRGDITDREAMERLSALRDAPVTTSALDRDLSSALALAGQLSHPVYDCLYLALALREQTYVITADKRFHAAVSQSQSLARSVRMLT